MLGVLRPGPRTCRSTSTTRTTGWRRCWPTRGPVAVLDVGDTARASPGCARGRTHRARGRAGRPGRGLGGRAGPSTRRTSSTPPARPAGPRASSSPHRGIVNRLRWMQDEYGLGAGDRVLQKTPASFDVSVWEFFWPLLVGAHAGRGAAGRPPRPGLPGRADRAASGSPRVHFVPSMLARVPRRAGRAPLRTACAACCCSGEALPAGLASGCRRRCPAPRCTTCTARPRPPSTSPRWHVPAGRRTRHACRSAGRCANTRVLRAGRRAAAGAGRACRASCTSPACSWPAATWAGPT